MTPSDDFERRLGNRLNALAERQVAELPPSQLHVSNRNRAAGGFPRSSFTRWSATVAAVLLGAAATIWGISALDPGPPTGAVQSSTAKPSSQEGSPSVAPTAPGESATPITGQMPAPDATAPKGAIFIPDLTIGKLNATLGKAGLSCESNASGEEGEAGVFYLFCTGADTAAGYEYTTIVRYWTLDRVTSYHLTALPLGKTGDPDQTRGAVDDLLGSSYTAVVSGEVEAWFTTKFGNASCTAEPCSKTFTGASVAVQTGEAGAFTLTVTGTAVEGQ